MAFPCCMGLNTGVRLAAVISLLLAAGVLAVSGMYMQEVYEQRESTMSKALDGLGNAANTLFNAVGIKEKVDPDKVYRIKISCSGVVFGAAALQFITSCLLLCCSFTKGGQSTAKLYAFINTWVMVALVAASVCFVTSGLNYQEDDKIQLFLGVCAADFILLIYLLCVAGAYVRS